MLRRAGGDGSVKLARGGTSKHTTDHMSGRVLPTPLLVRRVGEAAALSRKLAGLFVQRVHDLAEVLDCLQSRRVRFLLRGLIEDNEAACALVEDAEELLVEDHLGELGLDLREGEVDELGDVGNLDTGEGLNEAAQVLLEQRVVQRRQVGVDDAVVGELFVVRLESSLEGVHGAIGVGFCNGAHGIDVGARIPNRSLAVDELVHVLRVVGHDLAKEHVL
mmetsp:Transcript_7211/g.12300  ORF Transcript_7211/g.12300 Transcript_7211/m.12300 type:complete len:219 (-) Transcript_7211:784-1440(-)